MGEARRRKLAGTYPAKTAQPQPSEPPAALLNAVARAESVMTDMFTDPMTEKQCWWRNQALVPACALYGLEAREVIGGAIYQAGPDRDDCFPFCGPDNRAMWPGLFHVWTEVTIDGVPWVVDISTGQWDAAEGHHLDIAHGLAPVRSAHPLPAHLIAPKATVQALHRWHQPAPGAFFYSAPTKDPRFRRMVDEVMQPLRPVLEMMTRHHFDAMQQEAAA